METPKHSPKKSAEVYAIFVPKSPDRHLFSNLTDVKKFLSSKEGKQEGTRFKKCVDEEEIDGFFNERSVEERALEPCTSHSMEPVSPYKSPPIVRATEFRKAIEQRDDRRYKELMDENPGFLINTNSDRPNILHAGFHYNALHVACRASNHHVVKNVLELVNDLSWLTHVYGSDSCIEERSVLLLDAFLNTPDTAEHNTPLHYACKFGSVPIVAELLKYPTCKRRPRNKYNETPLDMLCRAYKGTPSEKRMAANQISIRCGMHSIRDKPNESETVEEQPTLSMAASKEQDLEKTIDDSQFEDMRQKNSKILDSQRNRILFFVESRFGLTSLGLGSTICCLVIFTLFVLLPIYLSIRWY